jgi:hypothetical protein
MDGNASRTKWGTLIQAAPTVNEAWGFPDGIGECARIAAGTAEKISTALRTGAVGER